MYHLTCISRTMSSGYETSYKKSFETLEEAAKYMHDVWYDEYCEDYFFPDEWDEEDRGCPFPKKEEFTYESLKNKLITDWLLSPQNDHTYYVNYNDLINFTQKNGLS